MLARRHVDNGDLGRNFLFQQRDPHAPGKRRQGMSVEL